MHSDPLYPQEDDPAKAGFIVVYSFFSFCGFLTGLLAGWAIWGTK